eukprot:TRINITY_DN21815_c0_g1_i2.p2 TRINITY_DN21815_c0_g1~~TRINITY_DN21815_c0_g1_i2.p2  ORF type:complete len:204 (-),score=65.84 TRINITY_DN21815_c0_g1_i2:123-734(-)
MDRTTERFSNRVLSASSTFPVVLLQMGNVEEAERTLFENLSVVLSMPVKSVYQWMFDLFMLKDFFCNAQNCGEHEYEALKHLKNRLEGVGRALSASLKLDHVEKAMNYQMKDSTVFDEERKQKILSLFEEERKSLAMYVRSALDYKPPKQEDSQPEVPFIISQEFVNELQLKETMELFNDDVESANGTQGNADEEKLFQVDER